MSDLIAAVTPVIANACLWVILAGFLVAVRMTRGDPGRRLWAVLFLGIVWILGVRPFGEKILGPLEGVHERPTVASLRSSGVQQVVILSGGSHAPLGELHSLELPEASSARFLGGMELAALLGPRCQVIFSGAAGRGTRERGTAASMRALAETIAPGRTYRAESLSGSTAEHGGQIRDLVGGEPFALVTSAYHMPRAVRSFGKAGLSPTPYPVNTLCLGEYRWNDWLPSVGGYVLVQTALREYLAWGLYLVMGW